MRWLRRCAVPLVLLAIVAAGVLGWRALKSPRGATWVAEQAVTRIAAGLGVPVTIGGARIEGDEIVLEDLRIGRGGRLLRVRIARARVDFQGLWRRTIHVTTLAVDGVRFRPDGWPHADPSQPPSHLPPIVVDALTLRRGRVFASHAAGTLLDGIRTDARVTHAGGRWDVALAQLGLRMSPAADLPVRASGTLAFDPDAWWFEASKIALDAGASRGIVDGHLGDDDRIDLALTALHVEPADLQRLDPTLGLRSAVDGAASLRGAWPRPSFEAALQPAAGGTLTADGDVRLATPLAAVVTARFRGLDPAACWTDAPAGRLAGRIRLDARDGRDGWRLRHRLALAPSRLGDLHLTATRVRGAGSLRMQRVHVAVATPQASMHADARVRLDDPWRGKGAAVVQLPGIADAPGPPLRVQVAARGGHRTPLRFDAVAGAAVVAGVNLTGATASARLADGLVQLRQATLTASHSRLTAQGVIDPTAARTALTFTGRFDLADAAARLGAEARGVADVDGRVHGALPPVVEATVKLPAGALGGVQVKQLAIDVALDDGGRRGTLTTTAASVFAAGVAPTTFRTRVGWRPESGAIVARVEDLALPPWTLASPATVRRANETTVDRLLLQDGRGGTIDVSGRLDGARGPDLALRVAALSLQPVCHLRSALDCRGRIDASAHLGGTATAPLLDADLTATDITIDDVKYGNLTLRARPAANRIAIDASLRHPTAGVLSVSGTIPTWTAPAGAPLDLRLHATDLAPTMLAALFPSQLRHVRGRLAADLAMRGTWQAPGLSGELTLDDGAIGLAANGVDYERVHLRMTGEGSTLLVREFTAETGDGRLAGSGRFYVSGDTVWPDLNLTLHELQVANRPAVSAAATGTVRLTGTLAAPEVTGTVELVDTTVRPSLLPMTRADLQPDPTIHVTDTRPRPSNTVAAPTVGPPAPVILDVTVTLGADCWIKRADAAIELGGTIRIRKALLEAPRFVGRIAFRRGWYTFQSTRFYIEGGSVTFPDRDPPVTLLDVTASYRATEYTVTAKVGGSLDQPALTLFSDPPLPEADVLALLLFGKPTQQLGTNETNALQQQAVALAAGYAVPGLKTSVMDALGVDTLDIEMGSTGTERIGQVRVGRYVAEDVFVSLAQEFGAGVAQVFGVEYALSRRVSVKASASTNGRGAIDLFWHRRY